MRHAVEIVGLGVFRGYKQVVRDFSAQIERSTWLGLVGANGSGKTTLLRAIGGRLPIASGFCRLDGTETATNRSARARAIGFAPPIERLPALLTIREMLELAGDAIDEQRQRNEGLWSALGLANLLDRTIGEASSGMRQRASIGLAFATTAAIVILDEPFNWLDPVAAFDTRTALAEKVASGTTLITALHDLTTLCGVCDHGILMAEGRATLRLQRTELRAGARDPLRFEQEMIAALRGRTD